jgi:hypothetical protein
VQVCKSAFPGLSVSVCAPSVHETSKKARSRSSADFAAATAKSALERERAGTTGVPGVLTWGTPAMISNKGAEQGSTAVTRYRVEQIELYCPGRDPLQQACSGPSTLATGRCC